MNGDPLPQASGTERPLRFGLIFFSSFEGSGPGDPYRLVIESARFADEHGFSAVWIPERHFTRDGWLYPNPSVLQAALARETRRIHLRAGSVVVPLHHPIRIVEEWAMVDNLSGGRVGLSLASGWHPNDFVFFPERYATRNEDMFRAIEILQKLWQREAVVLPGGNGAPAEIRVYPDPVQPRLPIWITAAGNPATFERAGRIGANLLTHMFTQSVEELAEKVRLYRAAREEHGHDPATGQVTVMLHTFVTSDTKLLEGPVRDAFCRYLRSASYLLDAIVSSRGREVDLSRLSEQDLDQYARFVFDRLASDRRVLFGTPEGCRGFLGQLSAVGVDEIACQLDFGLDTDVVLASLPHLDRLRSRWSPGWREEQPVALEANREDPAAVRATVQARCPEEVPGTEFYRRLAAHRVEFGASFQGVVRLWRRDGEALGQVRLPESQALNAGAYSIHPVLLDSCFQVLYAGLPGAMGPGETLHLPVGVRGFRLHRMPRGDAWSHAVVHSGNGTDTLVEGDVCITDEHGSLIAQAQGVQLRSMAQTTRPRAEAPAFDELCYEIAWEVAAPEATSAEAPSPPSPETWLVLAPEGEVGGALAALLEERGHQCILARHGGEFRALEGDRCQLRPDSPEDMQHLVEAVSRSCFSRHLRVLHLWSLDAASPEVATGQDLAHAQVLVCGSAAHLLQSLARMPHEQDCDLWLVTRGAQPVGSIAADLAVLQAPLWGFGRALAYEHPNLWGGLVDLDPRSNDTGSARALLHTVWGSSGEDQVAVRENRLHAARLTRRMLPASAPPAPPVRPDGSYLITGGLGDLGLLVARWLVERGARHLMLLSRTALPPRRAWPNLARGHPAARRIEAVTAMERQGANVRIGAVDAADEGQVGSFLDTARREGSPPVRGIVHAAANARGSIILNLDGDALDEVMRPKAGGAWLLHRLLPEDQLDFFVLYSALPSTLGWLGQGAASYAAANAFLDALAHRRRARGQIALSIAWGPWREIGLAERAGGALDRLAGQGVGSLSPQEGLAVFGRLLGTDLAHVAVASLDWTRVLRAVAGTAADPAFRRLVAERPEISEASAETGEDTPLRAEILAAGPGEREGLLLSYARENVARILRLSPSRLDPDQPLGSLGLDSLMAIELRNRAEADLGVRMAVVLLLQGPTLREVAAYLTAQLDDAGAAAAAPAKTPEAGAGRAPQGMNPREAERLLHQVESLSDDAVNSLLLTLVREKRVPGADRAGPGEESGQEGGSQ